MNWLRTALDPMPPRVVSGRGPGFAWRWLEAGALELVPDQASATSVLLSAGIHGDETAPIELLDRLVDALLTGRTALAVRLLVVLGNPEAARAGKRFVEHDLNRLFRGTAAARPQAQGSMLETERASRLENLAADFFSAGEGMRLHLDLHSAIRPSAYECFALLPHQERPYAPVLVAWLESAGIEAVLANRGPSGTFSYHTASACAAASATVELGRVQPFGRNDPARLATVDAALRALVAARPLPGRSTAPLKAYRVVAELIKRSDAFALRTPADVPNFTPFARGAVIASDGDEQYVVTHPEERIVFPNPDVRPGLRAGLMVVEVSPPDIQIVS
ncbi:MAG: succinylglutamate desuccinylase [Rhodocyclaceae bacterium]|jgi:succinylglutamate desuccinylase|nr:succinylglutamate desuccinylase [Rhodocyclaceae bacterium]